MMKVVGYMTNRLKKLSIYTAWSVSFGTVLALFYHSFSLSIFVLFAFGILTHCSKELITQYNRNRLSIGLLITLEIIKFTILLYFAFTYSWILFVVLIVTSFLLRIKRLFSYFDLNRFYDYLSIILNVGVINCLSFYVHTRFISLTVVYSLIPIVSLFLFLNRKKVYFI